MKKSSCLFKPVSPALPVACALAVLALFSFLSCTGESEEESSGPSSSQSELTGYENFLAQKTAWVEPENYTFCYDYRFGDSDVGAEFVTVVTDGEGVCMSNCAGDESKQEFHFTSISQLYDYFAGVWEAALASGTAADGS